MLVTDERPLGLGSILLVHLPEFLECAVDLALVVLVLRLGLLDCMEESLVRLVLALGGGLDLTLDLTLALGGVALALGGVALALGGVALALGGVALALGGGLTLDLALALGCGLALDLGGGLALDLGGVLDLDLDGLDGDLSDLHRGASIPIVGLIALGGGRQVVRHGALQFGVEFYEFVLELVVASGQVLEREDIVLERWLYEILNDEVGEVLANLDGISATMVACGIGRQAATLHDLRVHEVVEGLRVLDISVAVSDLVGVFENSVDGRSGASEVEDLVEEEEPVLLECLLALLVLVEFVLCVVFDRDELVDDLGAAVCDVGSEDALDELVAVVRVLLLLAGLLEEIAVVRLDGVLERDGVLDAEGRHGCEGASALGFWWFSTNEVSPRGAGVVRRERLPVRLWS